MSSIEEPRVGSSRESLIATEIEDFSFTLCAGFVVKKVCIFKCFKYLEKELSRTFEKHLS